MEDGGDEQGTTGGDVGGNVRLEGGLDVDVDTGLLADFPACRLAAGLSRFALATGVRPHRLACVTDETDGVAASDPDACTAGTPASKRSSRAPYSAAESSHVSSRTPNSP